MSAHRRKSLMPTGDVTMRPPDDDDDINDDEEEKRRRISERQDLSAKVKRKQNAPGSSSDNTPHIPGRKSLGVGSLTPVSTLPKPTNEQLSLLYNNCVKLLNENKINAKNAFQLKLIDYMSDIVLNKEISGGQTNFQVVGCTIDVGTKIYAARVDALHQNTYQVLSGLGHGGNDEETGGESQEGRPATVDDDDDNEGGEDESQANKKAAAKAKKKRIKKSSYIVENLETITAKSKDEFQDEDLYFSKISTCIENEGIAGVLLNKLRIGSDAGMLLIDKDERQDPAYQSYRHSSEPACGSFRSLWEFARARGIQLIGARLAPEFSFKFMNWDSTPDNDYSRIVQNQRQEDENLEEHRFDANNVHSRLNLTTENVINDMDVDLEMDGDHAMDITDNMPHGSEVTSNASRLQTTGAVDQIDDIRSLHSVADLTSLISTTGVSDYSYFNFDQLKLHNLPKHLKQIAARLAANQRGGENAAAGTTIAVKVRHKKEAPRLEFNQDIDFSKYFKVTKKLTYLVDRTIEKRSEKPVCLESERQITFDSKEFFQPFWKKLKAKILSDGQQVENLLIGDEHEGGPHQSERNRGVDGMDDDEPAIGGIDDDFVIPATAQTDQPFFSQNGGEFGPTNEMMAEPAMLPNTSLAINTGDMQPFDGDNLIEAPIQINAINLEYAKTAKNIDVRRLKQIIWALLNEEEDKQENNASTNDSALDQSKDPLAEKKRICASLKQIYSKLKPPLISQRVYDDLSVCIVFQMLLFLANEHGLILKNDPIGSDLVITSS